MPLNKKKTITIVIAGNSCGPLRRITVPVRALALAGLALAVCLAVVTYVACDYGFLKKQSRQARVLHDRLASNRVQLSEQRQQISSLAEEINQVKAKLSGLNEFEQKIRVIANLTTGSETNNLFGIGGIPPETIEADPAMERPNSMLREMHSQLNLLDSAFVSQEESFRDLLTYLKDKRHLLASTPAIRPVNGGWITSRFAYRKSPFTGRREFHHGLDIAARSKTPVMAPADGTVIHSGPKGSLGKAIFIDHGYGLVTRYAHLSECLKKKGETVSREDHIGLVGNTGLSTGPHLHYEVRVNGVPVDPQKYILN
ncbi:MAG: M23 family metallopeptidase [Desulfosudaceae bacterium]